jgi:hypothetical protein
MNPPGRPHPSPPIGRRPVPPIAPHFTDCLGEGRVTPVRTGLVSETRGTAAVRLLIGSHLLLIVQSFIVLASDIDLGPPRFGIIAILALSLAALAWSATDRFVHHRRSSGRHHHGH